MARSRRPPAPRAGALCCCCCCCPSRMVIPGARRSRRCPLVTARRGLPGGPGLASARRERGRAGPGRAERSAAERGSPVGAGARRGLGGKRVFLLTPACREGAAPSPNAPARPAGGAWGAVRGHRERGALGGCAKGGTPLGAAGGVCLRQRAEPERGAGCTRERGAPGRPKGEEAGEVAASAVRPAGTTPGWVCGGGQPDAQRSWSTSKVPKRTSFFLFSNMILVEV